MHGVCGISGRKILAHAIVRLFRSTHMVQCLADEDRHSRPCGTYLGHEPSNANLLLYPWLSSPLLDHVQEPCAAPCHERLWRQSSTKLQGVRMELTICKTDHEDTFPHSSRNASTESSFSPIQPLLYSIPFLLAAAVDPSRHKARELASQIRRKDSFQLQDQLYMAALHFRSYPSYEKNSLSDTQSTVRILFTLRICFVNLRSNVGTLCDAVTTELLYGLNATLTIHCVLLCLLKHFKPTAFKQSSSQRPRFPAQCSVGCGMGTWRPDNDHHWASPISTPSGLDLFKTILPYMGLVL